MFFACARNKDTSNLFQYTLRGGARKELSWTSADSWSVVFHNSTLLILSYRLIPRILLSDLFINTWILLVSAFVDLQVSEPYDNNCFTFELNSLNFVLLLYTFDVHTLSIILKATLALPSLSLTSSSVPPVLLTTRPRYVNSETSSIGPNQYSVVYLAIITGNGFHSD